MSMHLPQADCKPGNCTIRCCIHANTMQLTMQVILPEQQLLESSETWTAVLAHIPDAGVRQELHSAWTTSKGRESGDLNLARWKELLNKLSKMQVSSITI